MSNPLTPPQQPANEDETLWNIVSTLGPIVIGLFAPLLTYLLAKDKGGFVKEVAIASLNGQISYTIYMIIASFSLFILVGIILLPVVVVANLIFIIMSFLASQKREVFKYPLSFDIVKE